MFPGRTTKLAEQTLASAATIYPKADLVILTGTTGVDTIVPSFGGGFSGICILAPKDGAVALSATGNIAKAMTIPQNQSCVLVYSKTTGKWYPSAIS